MNCAKQAHKWYVLTGGPSAGKTSVIDDLTQRGYHTIPETARAYLEAEQRRGRAVQEVRKDEVLFQYTILSIKRLAEAEAPRDRIVFFDRGILDAVAYLRAAGHHVDPLLMKDVRALAGYRRVFLLDMLPFSADGVRTETAIQAKVLQESLCTTYKDAGIPVTVVPILPVRDRTDFILKKL